MTIEEQMMKFPRAIKRRPHGFTMVELMIVIAVIAILAATAVPGITNWLPSYRLKSAARGVYSYFQAAKLQAVRTNMECALFFNTGDRSCTIVSGGPDRVFEGGPIPQGDDVILGRTLLDGYGGGITFDSGDATERVDGTGLGGVAIPQDYTFPFVLFDNRGMVADQGYVYLASSEGESFAVGTPSLAGAIVMRKWYPNGQWQ